MNLLFCVAVGVMLMMITAITVTVRLRKRIAPIILISLLMFETIVMLSTGILLLYLCL